MSVIAKAMELYREYYSEPTAGWNDLCEFEQSIWFKKAVRWAQNNELQVTL